MAKINFISLATFLCMLLANYTYSQGCSDAGFCTINSFKPNSIDSSKTLDNQINIGGFIGLANYDILVYGSYLEFKGQLNKHVGIDAKLTTLAQSGNEISVFGFSDIFINANYKLNQKTKMSIGVKVPLHKANMRYQNIPLPMDYQKSLGTFDLIVGIGYEIKKIQFVAAVQQPLSQNKNQFFGSLYHIDSKLSTFQSTNKFQRSGDVLLRISYPLNINSKLKLTPSILPIYHIKNDKYTNEFNTQLEIKGSKGLTLNGNIYLDYEINNYNALQFNFGMPFIVRDKRPDGLTRSAIASLEYRIFF